MKFSCTKINLSNGLAAVAHVATKTSSLPILNNLLLQIERGGLRLTSTNLEVAVSTLVRGKVEGEGVVTVQAKLLSDLVGLLAGERVDIEVQGTDVLVTAEHQQSTIRGMVADDFPVIPREVVGVKVSLPLQELGTALNRTMFAVNPDEGRPEIGGVYFNLNGVDVVVVGTDSYRLAECKLKAVEGADKSKSQNFILPLRAVQELSRITALTATETIEVVVGESQVLWRLGETELVSRLVAGQYPDYQQIIPKGFSSHVQVDRATLLAAVRSTSLFVRTGINDIRLSLVPGGKQLRVAANNSQVGESAVELPTSEASGSEQEIVFNYRYLLDGLQAINTAEVAIEVVDGKNPGLLRPVTKKEADYLYIIMPIRQ